MSNRGVCITAPATPDILIIHFASKFLPWYITFLICIIASVQNKVIRRKGMLSTGLPCLFFITPSPLSPLPLDKDIVLHRYSISILAQSRLQTADLSSSSLSDSSLPAHQEPAANLSKETFLPGCIFKMIISNSTLTILRTVQHNSSRDYRAVLAAADMSLHRPRHTHSQVSRRPATTIKKLTALQNTLHRSSLY